MTWSIGASGTKDEVKAAVKDAPFNAQESERAAFETAQAFVLTQLDSMSHAKLFVTAGGSSSAAQISITGGG